MPAIPEKWLDFLSPKQGLSNILVFYCKGKAPCAAVKGL